MSELAALHVKLTGDSGGLVAAVNSADGAITSFGRVTTAAEANARGFDRALRNADGGASNLQRQINSLTGVLNNSRRSAESSAHAFDRLGTEAITASNQIAATSRTAGNLSGQVTNAGGSVANLASQFNDIGVMLAAGQSPLQLALQQGTQINQVFSSMGGAGITAAGRIGILRTALLSIFSPANLITIATIAGGAALFQFGMNALGAKDKVATYADALDDLENITNDISRANDILELSMDDLIAQYGTAAQRVRELAIAELELAVSRQRGAVAQAMQNEELQDVIRDYSRLTTVVDELGNTYYDTSASARAISRDLGVTGQTASELAISFNALQNALTVEDQVAAWTRIQALLERAGVSLSDLPPELAAALATVIDLEQAMLDYAAAAEKGAAATAAIKEALPIAGKGAPMSAQPSLLQAMGSFATPPGETGDTSGVGSSLANQIERDLEQLREGFMTQEELQIAAYESQQEILQEALERRLITQQEYNALMQDAQSQHQDRMSAIDVYRYGTGVQKTQQFMSQMASALQNGNEKMARISRVFAAGETLINAWRAHNQTLSDPTLPFFAKIPAALSILSAGMGAVNAIRGSGGAGGGGGGAGRAAASAAASQPAQLPTQTLRFDFGGQNTMGMEQIVGLLNDAYDRGYRIRAVMA